MATSLVNLVTQEARSYVELYGVFWDECTDVQTDEYNASKIMTSHMGEAVWVNNSDLLLDANFWRKMRSSFQSFGSERFSHFFSGPEEQQKVQKDCLFPGKSGKSLANLVTHQARPM